MDVLARWQGPFILAVIFSLFLPEIPPLFLLLIAFCLSLGLVYYRYLAISGFLCGFSWFFIHAHLATHWQLPSYLVKQPIAIIGQVAQIPHHNADNIKFTLSVKQIAGVNIAKWQSVNVKLNWRITQTDGFELKQGQVVALWAKLKPAHGFANLGGFSYSKWLLLKGIRATGYVYSQLPVTLVDNSPSLRQQLFDTQIDMTKELSFKGVLLALTMGEKQLIDKDRWQVIRATGIGHLLAISGLHIGMMFMFCHFLGLWSANCGNLIFKKPINAPIYAVVSGLVGALVYSWMAGFAITTIRALLMLSIAIMAVNFARGRSSKNVLLSALSVILLLDPLAILTPGLWLSFIAVVSILTLFWFWPEAIKNNHIDNQSWLIYIKAIFKIQLILFVCLLPLTALIFNGVSLSGSWVNLLAVPWVSFITVPLALVATLISQLGFDGGVLWWLADGSLRVLFIFVELPWNLSGWMSTGFLPWYLWLGLFIALITWILPVARLHKLASLCLLLSVLSYQFDVKPDKNSWRVDVLDVGQGLAVAIEHKNAWFIYDLGPIYPSGFNTVEQVVEPFLAYHGVSAVDWLVLSHADSDHAGAYQYFLSKFTVNHFIAPSELSLNSTNASSAQVCKPQTYHWQGLLIEVLWPQNMNQKPNQKLSRNDSSCVMRISNQYGSLLLPGDISKRSERQLVKADKAGNIELNADILLAPHHGSMSSSSVNFINAVNPKYVVFSSGFYNRYRFPRPEIVSRYSASDAVQHVTSVSGQISYSFTRQGIHVEPIRDFSQNLWYLNR